MAASAQSMSSTKSTVGVVRTWSSTRSVRASSSRVRSRWMASGAAVAVECGVGAGPFDHREVGVTAVCAEGVGHRDEQRVAQRQVGEVEVVVAATAQHGGASTARVLERLLRESGLADPGFTLDEHQVGEAAEREIDPGAQPGQLGPTPDQRARHRASVQVAVDDCHRGAPCSTAWTTHRRHLHAIDSPFGLREDDEFASSLAGDDFTRSQVDLFSHLIEAVGDVDALWRSTPVRCPTNPSTGRSVDPADVPFAARGRRLLSDRCCDEILDTEFRTITRRILARVRGS